MKYLIIGIGGFLGAVSRYLLESVYVSSEAGFPINTFLINIAGCIVLGVVLNVCIEKFVNENFKLGITAGFISSFTTFSTFTLEIVKLMGKGLFFAAFQYIFISLVAGLFAVKFGSIVGTTIYNHFARKKETEEIILEELE